MYTFHLGIWEKPVREAKNKACLDLEISWCFGITNIVEIYIENMMEKRKQVVTLNFGQSEATTIQMK